MFSLIPWKKRSGNIAVHRDEPVREWDRGYEGDLFPLARLRDEFDALVHRFFGDPWFGSRMGELPALWNESPLDLNWDLGWEDRGNEYVYQAELPGFEPGDFDVKISGNVLSVRAEHKEEKKEKKNGGSQYRYGTFTRSVTLPHGVDEQRIDARYHSGILELHLPKTEEAKGKRIEVKSA